MKYVIYNGKLMDEREVYISPQDRGFRYGDGVFDTFLVHCGRIYQYDFHIARLQQGLYAIQLEVDVSPLLSLCNELLAANNCQNALLRVQVTRGIGGRGYLPEKNVFPTLLIETMEIPPTQTGAISLWQSSYCKISPKALPVQFKLCQGLSSTLARIEAAKNNCFDALMLNEAGDICETSSANIFWLENDSLYTPKLQCGVLAGGIRNAIIRISPYPIHEVVANLETLAKARAVFITNVSYKIMPVNNLKPIGISWKSEELAAQMLHLLETDIARKTLN